MQDDLDASATVVADFFTQVFAQLHDWREQLERLGGDIHGAELDDVVAQFALPALTLTDPMLIGAGFIGDPAPDAPADNNPGLHFAWWLGPVPANPLLSKSDEPTRLDVTIRSYTEYVNDFSTLEWYRVPESTRRAHVTGPYVDHLCTCDYILTVTAPVLRGGEMFGVVGADVYVRRLERDVMPALLAVGTGAAVVNEFGRVVVSTDLDLPVGALLASDEQAARWETRACAGTPFSVVARLP